MNDIDPFASFIEWDGENAKAFDDLAISSEDEYVRALAELKKVWGAQKDTPEGRKLNALVNLIVAYEEENYPIEPLTNEEAVKGFMGLDKAGSFGEAIRKLFLSRRSTPPSAIVQEEFLAEDYDKEVVKKKLGFTTAEMDAFLAGAIPVTKELANKLSKAFGTSKELWLNLQRNCEIDDYIQQKRDDTEHLLSSLKNADRLQASIREFDNNDVQEAPMPCFEVSPLSEEDGGGYLISFPEYPGCIADGDTIKQAISEGRDALKAYQSFLEEVRKATKQEAIEEYEFKSYVMEIDGHKATITFDLEINMFRGEFIDLANGGGADFYSKDLDKLETEGGISLEVYFGEIGQKDLVNQIDPDNVPESFNDGPMRKEKL
ncbi:hypothetical protein [Terasakiella pusilla]|uniref:hypothetical protein n=1 Tax=Terasakiella pusilla TaxID=64973 RepID=UPI00068C6D96|nr:hypothetical protein [Terasakiella pusilla]